MHGTRRQAGRVSCPRVGKRRSWNLVSKRSSNELCAMASKRIWKWGVARPAGIFLAVPLHFFVVLVNAFVMASTVWSVSCLLFYSRCPVPWSRHHWLCVLYIGYRSNRNAVLCCPQNLNKALKQKRKKRPRNVLAVSAISIWTALAAETFRCFISRIVRRLTETKHFRRLETKYVLLFYFNCAGTIGRKRLRYRSNCGRYSPVTDTSHY